MKDKTSDSLNIAAMSLEAALNETSNYQVAKLIGRTLALICEAQHALYKASVRPVTEEPQP